MHTFYAFLITFLFWGVVVYLGYWGFVFTLNKVKGRGHAGKHEVHGRHRG